MPEKPETRLSVFICYSRRRREFAVRLQAGLEKNGMDVWIDLDDIIPTETWSEVVERGIEQADVFLFLVSPESVASKVCLRELEHAVRFKKKLVPILLAEAAPVPPVLAAIHFTDFTRPEDFEASLERLVWVLTTDLEWVRAHTRLLNQALAWERGGQSRSKLIWGRSLREAEKWLAADPGKDAQATGLHRRFIEASRKFVKRVATVGAVTAALVAVAVSGLALYSRAIRAAKLVDDLVVESQSSDDIQLATLLGAEALRGAEEIQWPWWTLVKPERDPLNALQGTVSLWARRLATPLNLKGAWPDSVSFTPEGDIVAVLAEDSLRLWRWNPERPAVAGPWPLESGATAMTFTADGTRIAVGGNVHRIRIYDAREWITTLQSSGKSPRNLPAPTVIQNLEYPSNGGEEDLIGLAACSDSSGEYLAAGLSSRAETGPRHRLLVWKLTGAGYGNPEKIPQGRRLFSLALSADCRFLATIGDVAGDPAHQARLYKSQPGGNANIFDALKADAADDISLLRITHRPNFPATSSPKTQAPAAPKIEPITTRGNPVAVALSPDGGLFAIALTNPDSAGGTAAAGGTFVGDSGTREERTRLPLQAVTESLALGPNNRLATAALNSPVQIWEVDRGASAETETDALLEQACGFVEANLTRGQWNQYLPGKRYRKTCPRFP